MNEIEELISKMCPSGVQFMPITETAKYCRGLTYSKEKENLQGSIKVLRANNINQKQNILDLSDVRLLDSSVKVRIHEKLHKNDILMSVASGSRSHVGKVAFIWEDLDYYFGGFMAVWRTNEFMNPRFLFHILTSSSFSEYLDSAISSSTINNLSESILQGFIVPVPPIDIQAKIVAILDEFTELVARLEAELQAELESKQKQFEFYRNLLLNFQGQQIPTYPLGEIGTTVSGLRGKSKSDFTDGNAPFVSYVDISNNPALNFEVQKLVKVDAGENQNQIQLGDVLITGSSETKIDVGLTSVVTQEPKLRTYINSFCFIWRPNRDIVLLPDFSKHLFRGQEFREKVIRTANGVTRQNISKSKFLAISIPIPPIEMQREIVKTLDQLESLSQEISKDLQAEIKARRQQYEYYRKRLLTFLELVVA